MLRTIAKLALVAGIGLALGAPGATLARDSNGALSVKLCPDGSTVAKTAPCPAATTVAQVQKCADGTVIPAETVALGGKATQKWCLDWLQQRNR